MNYIAFLFAFLLALLATIVVLALRSDGGFRPEFRRPFPDDDGTPPTKGIVRAAPNAMLDAVVGGRTELPRCAGDARSAFEAALEAGTVTCVADWPHPTPDRRQWRQEAACAPAPRRYTRIEHYAPIPYDRLAETPTGLTQVRGTRMQFLTSPSAFDHEIPVLSEKYAITFMNEEGRFISKETARRLGYCRIHLRRRAAA